MAPQNNKIINSADKKAIASNRKRHQNRQYRHENATHYRISNNTKIKCAAQNGKNVEHYTIASIRKSKEIKPDNKKADSPRGKSAKRM